MEKEPVSFFLEVYPQALARAKDRLGTFLNCPGEGLALIRNTTEGVNSILGSVSWSSGDEILVTNLTYPACYKAAASRTHRDGTVTRIVDINPNWTDEEIVEAIDRAITKRTRLVLCDYVTSATALVLPARQIVNLCRARGVLCAVDGAHAPGMLPIDLTSLRPDFFVGNLHKWCCAPKGSAFLYVDPKYRGQMWPTSVSHGFEVARSSQDMGALFDWPGTHDPTAWFSIPAAIDFMENLHPNGLNALRAETVALRREADAMIADILPILSDQRHRHGWMTTFRLPDTELGPLSALEIDPFQRALNRRHGIQIPVTNFPAHPNRVIRFSVAPYNVIDDYQKLGTALVQMLKESNA